MNQNIKDSLDRYAKEHCPTGGFLAAVLANDLMDAMGRAGDDNQRDMMSICSYVYNHIPANCHGSREIVKDWLAARPVPPTDDN